LHNTIISQGLEDVSSLQTQLCTTGLVSSFC
jgi:hypothetical protein